MTNKTRASQYEPIYNTTITLPPWIIMRIEYDPALPISDKVSEIKKQLKNNQVLIVAGDTGSGKSTQLPKICMELGFGQKGKIAHTQPRRLAATSIAKRLCDETQTELGAEVGYQIRFAERVSVATQLVLMTDGMLLAHIEKDRMLKRYNCIIIDEAHERSLNIDFILGFCKQMLKKRPELKLIVTSATIDVDRFSEYFNDAPVINVGGKMYDVAIEYQPAARLTDGVYDALIRLGERNPIDTLVFLPTERDINEVSQFLSKQNLFNTEILPLFSRLDEAKQQRIFKRSSARKVILSTNIAETSLTVPGIGAVIDSGLVRIKRYSSRSKVERLPIEAISKASAKQRMGRAGRLGPGVCIRLYDEEDFKGRPDFTDPEIRRSNLASVILKMKIARLGDIREFDFIEPVDSAFISDGFRLLHELCALDEHHHLTTIGREIAKFPLEPRLARAIIMAKDLRVLDEVLIIVSGLAVPDSRLRPMDRQTKADQLHARFNHVKSDFLGFLRLYLMVKQETSELSNRKRREYFEKNLLSMRRWQEWMDVYRQLRQICTELKWPKKPFELTQNPDAIDKKTDAITRSFLPGMLSHLGLLDEPPVYQGARGVGFSLFPGTSLKKQTPKWVMGYELIEIKKVFLRVVCPINAAWIEPSAKHLLKTQVFDPFWSVSGYAMAYESVSLYGLEIITKRKINYAPHDPVHARKLFIQGALLDHEVKQPMDFMLSNQALLEELEALEHQSRTMGIIADEKVRFDYFDQLLPANISDLVKFTKWFKTQDKSTQQRFTLTREVLLINPDVIAYPETVSMTGNQFKLEYHFASGAIDDGVSLIVPLEKLGAIDPVRVSYLVGPMLLERIEALIKSLPKPLRVKCMPAKEYAAAVCETIDIAAVCAQLTIVMAKELSRMTGTQITHMDFNEDAIAAHLRMNYKLYDGDELLSQSRWVENLLGEYKETSEQAASAVFEDNEQRNITRWDFGDLAEQIESEEAGVLTLAYPAIIDCGDSVSIVAKTNQSDSLNESAMGVCRLYRLHCAKEEKQIKRELKQIQQLKLLSINVDFDCVESFMTSVFSSVFDVYEVPFTQVGFLERLDRKGELFAFAQKRLPLLVSILTKAGQVLPLFDHEPCEGAEEVFDYLLFDRFIELVPENWLARYPVYLDALIIRLEKAKVSPAKDQDLYEQVAPLWERFGADAHLGLLDDIHFMLHELNISLFAQHLKTSVSVSVKKIQKKLAG